MGQREYLEIWRGVGSRVQYGIGRNLMDILFLHIGYLIIIGASVIGVLVLLYKKGCFRRRKILVEEGHRGVELTPGHREVEMSPGDFAHGHPSQLPEHAPERAYRVLESA